MQIDFSRVAGTETREICNIWTENLKITVKVRGWRITGGFSAIKEVNLKTADLRNVADNIGSPV